MTLLLALLGCSASQVMERSAQRTVERFALEPHALELGPHRVKVHVGGQGAPLLLVHGFGGDGLGGWKPQITALADDHTLIVPDLPWFGDSVSTAEPCLDTQSDALLATLDALGFEAVDLVGISYGGFVALDLVMRAPERFPRAVVLDSPGAFFDADDQAAMAERLGAPDVASVFVPDGPEALRRLMVAGTNRDPGLPPRMLADIYEADFSQHHDAQRGLLADLPEHREAFLAHDWSRRGELELIWGEEDRVFPPESGQELAEFLGVPLVMVPGGAHAVSWTHPEVVNAELERFLAR